MQKASGSNPDESTFGDKSVVKHVSLTIWRTLANQPRELARQN
jgi:hypothetical protein